MNIGVLRETKNNENRVALTPDGATMLFEKGHRVYVEKGLGAGSGFEDGEFRAADAKVLGSAREVAEKSELILKIKEPIGSEFSYFNKNHLLFTYFHFASSKELTMKMLDTKATCIAYETVETSDRRLPLLAPMSEVAGKMAPQIGAYYLAKPHGGKGLLLSTVRGTAPSHVVVLGAGIAGQSAAEISGALGAKVTILELNDQKIEHLKKTYPKFSIQKSTPENIEAAVSHADILVGAVLVPGAKAPKVVTRKMVSQMQTGSVIVDISIDQGGCIETSRPTSHSSPVYIEEGVVHYCVTNMPGAFPRTSTFALTNATLPYVLELAEKGKKAFSNHELYKGVNMFDGQITNKGVADAFSLPYKELKTLL